ncbi:MAG: divergent polysaccharide deacetylase family protein [Gammaproteobacteria bacterium]|nr:divergent polysaccharide deacetylase family protein [Gammaproteobacteria bacterium]NNF60149.1 divergent polysaccharide deacetylase family protein [Gammaproteobacteria bacterium]NNM21561.1 divergent polysaccharide deacetylase family protein [Gammaproteobacteria bacterium]
MTSRNSNLPRWLLLTGILALNGAQAEPVIALIVDDLGFRYSESRRATALPGPVACAVIPGTPHGEKMARAAHASGKEVMLHLPMEPVDRSRPVGAHGIDLQTTRDGITSTLQAGIEAVPHVSGVNNHMGSLITRHPGHMSWLMQDLRESGLFFVDSVTTESSVALSMAREAGVSATRRDMFLDSEQADEQEIHQRLQRLVELAQRRGHALGIAHPFPATMTVLERELPRLDGVKLVSVRELIALRSQAQQAERLTIAVEKTQ